jgi:ribosome biogenesis GTPase / thiamine phosphate phosphatase
MYAAVLLKDCSIGGQSSTTGRNREMNGYSLSELGWNRHVSESFAGCEAAGLIPLRVAGEYREYYTAWGEGGEYLCEVTGKFRYSSSGRQDFPAVGDWVAAAVVPEQQDRAMIHAVLPRRSLFSRKAAGEVTDEQPAAANIDLLCIVTGLDDNYSLRRIERYAVLAWESRAEPVVLLNKADLREDAHLLRAEVEDSFPGTRVIVLSAANGTGMDEVRSLMGRGLTAAFVGSSGVGKTTIVNSLLGSSRFAVNEVSSLGSRGRHTTTRREMVLLETGGLVIDTPGMRELQLWVHEGGDGLERTFEDIELLSRSCRFRDCRHGQEPGCAVRAALESGELDEKRFKSYLKLKREQAYAEARQSAKVRMEKSAKRKEISRLAKEITKEKRRAY